MKLKQTVNLLLIALFVWAFQSKTIHYQQHAIEEVSECTLCQTSEQLTPYHNNTPTLVLNEHFAVKVRKDAEKIVIKSRYDYTKVRQFTRVDIVVNQRYSVDPIPLGYHATAPPFFTS